MPSMVHQMTKNILKKALMDIWAHAKNNCAYKNIMGRRDKSNDTAPLEKGGKRPHASIMASPTVTKLRFIFRKCDDLSSSNDLFEAKVAIF